MDELEKIMKAVKEERLKLEEAEQEEADLQAKIERIKRSQRQQSKKYQSIRTHKFCVFAGAFWSEFRKLTITTDEQMEELLSNSDRDMEAFARKICKLALSNSKM